jgi:hypothetical protein
MRPRTSPNRSNLAHFCCSTAHSRAQVEAAAPRQRPARFRDATLRESCFFLWRTTAQKCAPAFSSPAPPVLDYAGSMLQRRAARLFHGVVLAGGALGCGARASEPAADGERSQGGSEPPRGGTAAPITPAPNAEAPPPGAVATLSLVPPAPPRCETNQQLRCTALGPSGAAGCHCEDIVARSPSDCARPEQFQCGDAGAGGCACDAASAEPGCPALQIWTCDSYAPETACRCLEVRIR